MNLLEKQLFRSEFGDVQPRLAVRSDTRVDAGRWLRATPLWICLLDSEVVVLAVSRRRYLQRMPIADCAASHYCHATGELVLAPTEALTYNRLALKPRQALEILGAMGCDVRKPVSSAPEADMSDSDVTALLNSDSLLALLSEEERQELAHLSIDEIRALMDADDTDEH